MKPKVIKKDEVKPPMNDDLRRLCLSLRNVLKREFPTTWRQVLSDVVVPTVAKT